MKKGIAAIMMLICSMGAAVFLDAWCKPSNNPIQTMTVQNGEFAQSVWLQGAVDYDGHSPLMSYKTGTVSQVYVTPGKKVKKGDLVISIDCSAEEAALTSLYQLKQERFQYHSGPFTSSLHAFAWSNNLEWNETERQLRAGIESAKIRADADGIVESVWVKPGERINAGMIAGNIRGSEKRIVACSDEQFAGAQTQSFVAHHHGKDIPLVFESCLKSEKTQDAYMLWFKPIDSTALDELQQGAMIELEVINSTYETVSLVPLTAIDGDGYIWSIRDGKVYKQKIDLERCNRSWVAVSREFEGERVVLYPDQYELKDGMSIQ